MGKSRATKACPYCAGKGYVSIPVDLPPDDDPGNELTRTTWVRKPCPLCGGKGNISGDDAATRKVPRNGHQIPLSALPIFRQVLVVSAVSDPPTVSKLF